MSTYDFNDTSQYSHFVNSGLIGAPQFLHFRGTIRILLDSLGFDLFDDVVIRPPPSRQDNNLHRDQYDTIQD